MPAKASTVPAINAPTQPVLDLLERVTTAFSRRGGKRLGDVADEGEAA